MRALSTASQLDRNIACSASMVLPREEFTDSVYSIRGTRLHSAIEVATLGGRWEDIRARAPEDVGDAELKNTLEAWAAVRQSQFLKPIGGFPTVEVTMGLTPETGMVRLMGSGLGRKYEAGPGEVVGTLDYAYLKDGVVTVVDVKTGNPSKGKQPLDTWQMRFGALSLWLWHDRPPAGADLILWYTREGVRVRHAHATPAMLEGWLRDLHIWVMVAGRVITGEMDAEPVKNRECHFCPSKRWCPWFGKEPLP